jgi:FdhD protein
MEEPAREPAVSDADAASGAGELALAARRIERRAVTRRDVLRCTQAGPAPKAEADTLASEEPLEIRLATDTFATVMRTPGEDRFLVAGFLFSEGIISELADLGRVAHCGRPSDLGYGNVIDVAPGPGVALAPELTGATGRATLTSTSCGVCGRERIDDLLERLGPIPDAERTPLPVQQIAASIAHLESSQQAFRSTGAVHAALACRTDGTPLAASEDVGRHNAVDKVIGKLLYAGYLSKHLHVGSLLAVSGRTSFEIVQKAAAARLAIVVSVSAPTSLAVDLAEALGVTLIGFARAGSFNVYSHAQRIRF